MTVLEVIQRSSEFLARKGVDSPRLQVELLLAHVLQRPRLRLYLEFDRTVTERELDNLRQLVKRRSVREPLQQILGHCNFCGYEIAVDRQVLVPRPETEQLAEQAWQFLEQLALGKPSRPLVLDVGTGSGCLAVVLAKKSQEATIHAIDISRAALALAEKNAASQAVAERIQFFQGDGFAAVPAGTQYDLIVSNPPYIPRGQIPGLQVEVRDYEPHIALDGGEDGLVFFKRLSREASPFLRSGGRLMLELGDGQEGRVREILAESGWHIEAVHADHNGQPRILIACREV